MRITFRFTDNEYRQFRQLNRTATTPRWKSYLLALLCLVPSFCLILGTKSLIAILAAAMILISMLTLAIAAVFGDKSMVDKHDHVMNIDQSTILESQSHSRWETRWDYFDKFQEDESFYLLGRLDRYSAIPKRSIETSQRDQFASYCKQINDDSDSQPATNSAVSLFTELFPASNQLEVFEFTYLSDDLTAAMSDPLHRVDLSGHSDSLNDASRSKPSPGQSVLGTFWLVIFSLVLLYVLISVNGQFPRLEQWTVWQYVYLVLAIILPFKLMRWLNRWFRSQRKSEAARVPTEPISMQLMSSGWAIGNSKSCQFFDWRDVESFYQNKFCFGFHTFNDLVQIVPKRIFSTQEQSEQFLNRAINLRREHLRSFAPTAVAVETGNPYQAPAS